VQSAFLTEDDMLADDAIRPDFATGADLRLGVDYR
jgi:hypothetical protein